MQYDDMFVYYCVFVVLAAQVCVQWGGYKMSISSPHPGPLEAGHPSPLHGEEFSCGARRWGAVLSPRPIGLSPSPPCGEGALHNHAHHMKPPLRRFRRGMRQTPWRGQLLPFLTPPLLIGFHKTTKFCRTHLPGNTRNLLLMPWRKRRHTIPMEPMHGRLNPGHRQ